jgi:hypothetical protein
MAFSVFISYSTHDLPSASALQGWVAPAGASPFLAEYSLEPGRSLPTEILAAIKACDLFLLLWSANARLSDWVPQEIGVARGAEKPIIPIVLHDGLTLPGFVSDLKYLPVYRDPQSAAQWMYEHLLQRVKRKESDAWVVAGVVAALLLLLASSKK